MSKIQRVCLISEWEWTENGYVRYVEGTRCDSDFLSKINKLHAAGALKLTPCTYYPEYTHVATAPELDGYAVLVSVLPDCLPGY